MQYLEYRINIDEEGGEILAAFLADMGFESFLHDGDQCCYIEEGEHAKFKEEIEAYLGEAGANYCVKEIETQNWNEQWESDFEPIVVDSRLTVRAPHHPVAETEAEIVILANMSFGTGHHPTTHMMLSSLLEMELEGRDMLDVGCGSGVLGILGALRGAGSVTGVDIDDWAVSAASGNFLQNGISKGFEVLFGDVSVVEGRSYDVVVANIARNVLIHDMEAYSKATRSGGTLLCSGFLHDDAQHVIESAEAHGFTHSATTQREGWVLLEFSAK